jgi:hypothetical protein
LWLSYLSSAASRNGIANAANKVIAVKDVNVLDFMLSSSAAECGTRDPRCFPQH